MSQNRVQDVGQRGIEERVTAIAHGWDVLDNRCINLRTTDGIGLRGIKLQYRGTSWLVIVQAEVEGQRFVMFREASSSGDIIKVIHSMLSEPEWKPDKFNQNAVQ